MRASCAPGSGVACATASSSCVVQSAQHASPSVARCAVAAAMIWPIVHARVASGRGTPSASTRARISTLRRPRSSGERTRVWSRSKAQSGRTGRSIAPAARRIRKTPGTSVRVSPCGVRRRLTPTLLGVAVAGLSVLAGASAGAARPGRRRIASGSWAPGPSKTGSTRPRIASWGDSSRSRPGRPAARRRGPPARQGGVLDGALRRGAGRVRRRRDLPPDRRARGRGDLLAGRSAVPPAPARRGAGPLRALPGAQARVSRTCPRPSTRVAWPSSRRGAPTRARRHVPGVPPRLSEPRARADARPTARRGSSSGPSAGTMRSPCSPRTRRATRGAPTSPRRATSSASPRWRPAGPKACGRSSSSSPSRRGNELTPTARVLAAEAQAKASRIREALEHYQALVRAAPTHPVAPQALYRIGELSLKLSRPAEAEAAWSTLRRDFPQDARAGPAGLATAHLHAQRKQWDQALEVAQSVAGRRGDERSDALAHRRAERVAAAQEPRGGAGLPCGARRIAPDVQALLRGAGGPGRLARGGDRPGRRQARVSGDRRHEPGPGAGALGEASARRARAPPPPPPRETPTPTKSKAKP